MLLLAPAASGHHSVAGQFDPSSEVVLTGVIARVDWINPHIYVYLDSRDQSGGLQTWRLATAPPAFMRKAGITKALLMADGAEVKVTAIVARDGTPNLGWIYTIDYPDGHRYQLSGGR
jgi:hypothetical protein